MNAIVPMNENSTVPDYILAAVQADGGDMGTALLDQYVKPPLLKMIQGLTPQPAKDLGPEGTIYLSPTMQCVWRPAFPAAGKPAADPPILVVPIFQFAEYIAWYPRGCELGKIRERTFDRNSPLGVQARKFKQEEREYDIHELPGKKVVCQEHINVIFMFYGHADLHGMEAMLSFSKTDLTEGKNFCTTVKQWGNVPIYAQMYAMQCSDKGNAKGKWKGWQLSPALKPDSSSARQVVPAEIFPWTHQRYKELLRDYESGLIDADYDNDDSQASAAPAAPATTVSM